MRCLQFFGACGAILFLASVSAATPTTLRTPGELAAPVTSAKKAKCAIKVKSEVCYFEVAGKKQEDSCPAEVLEVFTEALGDMGAKCVFASVTGSLGAISLSGHTGAKKPRFKAKGKKDSAATSKCVLKALKKKGDPLAKRVFDEDEESPYVSLKFKVTMTCKR